MSKNVKIYFEGFILCLRKSSFPSTFLLCDYFGLRRSVYSPHSCQNLCVDIALSSFFYIRKQVIRIDARLSPFELTMILRGRLWSGIWLRCVSVNLISRDYKISMMEEKSNLNRLFRLNFQFHFRGFFFQWWNKQMLNKFQMLKQTGMPFTCYMGRSCVCLIAIKCLPWSIVPILCKKHSIKLQPVNYT